MADSTPLTFSIITTSDTRNLSQDSAGAAIEKRIMDKGWKVLSHTLVRDEQMHIAEGIRHATEDLHSDIVITCGGTGLSPRDVTPEATHDICEREVPGIAEGMRYHSLQITPRAMLSRACCMQHGDSLVINLPGSLKAACENWDGVVDVLEHAVSMMHAGGHEE